MPDPAIRHSPFSYHRGLVSLPECVSLTSVRLPSQLLEPGLEEAFAGENFPGGRVGVKLPPFYLLQVGYELAILLDEG